MCEKKNSEAINHFSSFIAEFVPNSHKKRWTTLLNFNKPRFGDIEPYDIWPEDNKEIKNCSILNVGFNELIRNEPYINFKDKMVIVIPCGHDEKKPEIMALQEVLNGDYYLLEGLISIVKGKLAILVNHDGEACIFKK